MAIEFAPNLIRNFLPSSLEPSLFPTSRKSVKVSPLFRLRLSESRYSVTNSINYRRSTNTLAETKLLFEENKVIFKGNKFNKAPGLNCIQSNGEKSMGNGNSSSPRSYQRRIWRESSRVGFNCRPIGNRMLDSLHAGDPVEALTGGGWSDGPPGGNDDSSGKGRGFGGGGGGDPPGDSSDSYGNGGSQSSGLWERYCFLVEKHPLATKGITAALLNTIADLFCQLVVERKSTVDLGRLLSFAAIGLLLVGPSLHIWYGLLPRLIPVPGDKGTLLRLALDQLIFAPLSLASFFAIVMTLEGKSDLIVAKLKKDLAPTVIAQWKLWIPFQFANFKFVPSSLQVATASAIGLVWTVYMSLVAHSDNEDITHPPPTSNISPGTYQEPSIASR